VIGMSRRSEAERERAAVDTLGLSSIKYGPH
jgi:hypothetical protein